MQSASAEPRTLPAAELDRAQARLAEAVACIERAREATDDPHLAIGIRRAASDVQAAARKLSNALNWIRTR